MSQALCFNDLQLKILILEPCSKALYDSITDQDTRTTALSFNTKNFYYGLGIWDKLSKQAGPIQDIKIVDADYVNGDSPLKLSFSSEDVGEGPMGYIIENGFLKKCVLKEINSRSNIEIKYGTSIYSYKNNMSDVELKTNNGEDFFADIVIVADGKNSKLRELLEIKTTDKQYFQTAITFNIEHENSHNQTAIERFMPTGPFAVLPMHKQKKSSIVWTVPDALANIYLNMDIDDFISEVQSRLLGELGKIKLVSEKLTYPLSLKYVQKYYQDRFVLIGDVAHGIHPIAGQGFNQGVKDIQKLTLLINERISLGLLPYSEDIFKTYQAGAFIDNKQMILATDLFNSLFSNDNKILQNSRRIGISAVDKLESVKSFFIKKAMGQKASAIIEKQNG